MVPLRLKFGDHNDRQNHVMFGEPQDGPGITQQDRSVYHIALGRGGDSGSANDRGQQIDSSLHDMTVGVDADEIGRPVGVFARSSRAPGGPRSADGQQDGHPMADRAQNRPGVEDLVEAEPFRARVGTLARVDHRAQRVADATREQ